MKKIVFPLVLTLSVLSILLGSPVSSAAPSYAKWGTVAVKAAQQKYQADIVDYKHVSRTKIRPGLTEEKFKLIVKKAPGKEFGVIVRIRFNPANDQLQSILFTETQV